MRMKRGLRRRIAATFALFAFVVLLIQTIGIVMVTDAQEEEFIHEILAEEMESLREAYRETGDMRPPRGQLLTGHIVRTAQERASLPQDLRDLPAGDHEIFRGAKEFHVEVAEEAGTLFYVLYDASPHERRIQQFKVFLIIAVVAVSAVSIWAGYWLSGVLVRQVSDLAGRVSRLDPAEGASRLADGYRDEEVVTLASAFDRYHDRVAEIVEREKQFTSNVSHELRTPLTTLKTSCELLAQDPAIAGKSRQRLDGVARAADRMTELTQALLLLARDAPPGAAHELVELREAAEDAVAPFREGLARRRIDVELRVPENAVARVHRPALDLALSNLLRNAATYTDHGRITVDYDAGTLIVADTGCGIEPQDLHRIFDRFYRGGTPHRHAEGMGLGLAIVKHIADRFGWRVAVASEPGKGSTFMIEFPPSSQFHHT